MLISQKTIKATDFKFGTGVPRDSPDMTPKIYPKGAWPCSRDSLNFWALNAHNSKTVKATDLKFDKSVPRESPDMTPKFFPKGAWPESRDPLNFSALNANAWRRYALSWAPSSFQSAFSASPSDPLPSASDSTSWFWRFINLLTYLLTYFVQWIWDLYIY